MTPVINGTASRHNTNKIELGSIPPSVLLELGKLCTKGALKYPSENGQPNWTKGFSYTSVYNSLMRHMLQFMAGETVDEETECHHLAAVMWGAMVLLYFEQNPEEYKKFDDRFFINTKVSTTI